MSVSLPKYTNACLCVCLQVCTVKRDCESAHAFLLVCLNLKFYADSHAR